MAILGMDGFDHYTTATDPAELAQTENYTTSSNNNLTISTTTRFSSGKSLLCASTGQLRINLASAVTNTMLVSFAYMVPTITGNNRKMMAFFNNIEESQVYIRVESNGTLQAYRGTSTEIGSPSTQAMSGTTWYWVEVKLFCDNSGSLNVKVNGEDWLSLPTTDTLVYSSTPLLNEIRLQAQNGDTAYYDDIAWQDDDGDFLGDSRIETFTPTGDASVTWDNSVDAGPPNTVTNASTIDEIPVDDADYVYTATVDEEDLYDFNTISNDDTVHAISLKYRAQKSDTGARSIQSRTSEAVTATPIPDVQGGAEKALSTTWLQYSDVFETTDDGDPDAGTAWSQTLIGDATFGIKVTA